MNFLPIVQRELLVAAKSRRGFRLRMAVAVGATLLGVLTVVGWNVRGGMRAGGDGLFRFLSFLFFLVCCLSGVFLTADCLSREKREGTFGLLFLTDLRGVDIILGKLASTSLMTLLMVIGGFPVLAICVLMGGVTGAELFRTCLALLLTMFISLSVGMFVSTFVRESGHASGITLLFLLLAVIGIPALTNLAAWLSEDALEVIFYFNFVSPTFLFGSARVASGIPDHFFKAAGLTTLVSLGLLGLASFYVRYTWQDRPRAQFDNRRGTARPAFRAKRDRLLDQNPVLWLMGAGVWQGRLLAGVAVVLVAAGFVLAPDVTREALPFLTSFVLPYLLALSIASHATQFFVQMRQQGAQEFLLSTPLTDREILDGQWRVLGVRFLPAAVVIFLLIWIPGSTPVTVPLLPEASGVLAGEVAVRGYLTLKSIVLWLGAGWAGMAIALRTKRTQFAGLWAMVVAVVLPWLSWCLPEIITCMVVYGVCRDSVNGKVRQTITRRLETDQPV